MGDPRLNSLHLDPTRRQDYRRAREALLQSRGNETIYAERQRNEEADSSNTFIRNQGGAAPNTLEFWLVDREYIYPLKVGLNTMGRSADNDVVVEDLYVSRRHCAILVHHNNQFVLHDTASKNGTFLNGAKINGPTAIKAGDEIRICNRNFVFLTRSDAASPPGGPPTHTVAG
jgi:pSer/pThr/pTyr-binding forkhead associated (FHA) protein